MAEPIDLSTIPYPHARDALVFMMSARIPEEDAQNPASSVDTFPQKSGFWHAV